MTHHCINHLLIVELINCVKIYHQQTQSDKNKISSDCLICSGKLQNYFENSYYFLESNNNPTRCFL